MWNHRLLIFSLTLSCIGGGSAAYAQGSSMSSPMGSGQTQSPHSEQSSYMGQAAQENLAKAAVADSTRPASTKPGGQDQPSNGGLAGGGSITPQPQALETISDKNGGKPSKCELRSLQSYTGDKLVWKDHSVVNGDSQGVFNSFMNSTPCLVDIAIGRNSDNEIATMNQNYAIPGMGSGGQSSGGKVSGNASSTSTTAAAAAGAAAVGAQMHGNPGATQAQTSANQSGTQASNASSAGEDAMQCMEDAFDGMTQFLVNVGNEDAGSPCSSDQVTKTYENAAWMVMQMYKACFLPMAILFLLPGALITNMRHMISFGILANGNDEEAVSPFAGIFRSIIAIFLIPASQMIISYMVDVGNSLEYSCQPFVNIPLIMIWCEEQVQTFSPSQQGNPIKNQPVVSMAPWRGKAAGMPVKGAVMEQISGLDGALADLANQCMHMLSEGLTICYAFQIVMICYLLCLGPLAAAFFAWPAVGRDLFRKCFATWVDAVVVLCLWKFWWNVVLICMTVRLQTGGINPYDPFEVYYLVAFLCILLFVPFSPFDFKPGDIVSSALDKANAVAGQVAQSGAQGGGGHGGQSKKASHATK